MKPSILVGVDGSDENLVALDWAVDAAVARGYALRVLYSAWLPTLEPVFLDRESYLRENAQRVLADAEKRVHEQAPDLPVETVLVYDGASHALVRASARATLVVVGLRGRGGFPGMKIGSVAYQVAAHATTPVVVVGPERPIDKNPAEVVVGLDDSPHGAAALRAAFTEARRRGARVRAVHAARYPDGPIADAMLAAGYSREFLRAEQERHAEDALADLRTDFPDVDVVVSVRWDDATHALSEASVTALLVVVGARGRHGFPRMALGSVAHGLLHHARSPVMVVHVPESQRRVA